MIVINNHLGNITLSNQFFTSLIGGTVTNCFGVVDMNVGTPRQSLLESIPFKRNRHIDKGVAVKISGDKLYIGLHITVMYGVNVSSVVKSIQHKVRYAVEEETGLSVSQINVYVDGIKS